MGITTISGEIQAQPLNDNFSYLNQSKNQLFINLLDYATGDGVTDDTLAINTAIQAAYSAGTKLFVPKGIFRYREYSVGCGYAVLNPGVSIVGTDKINSIFAPLSTMPNTADFMLVQPTAGADLSFIEFAGFIVWPGYTGTKYGRKSIYMPFTMSTNISEMHMHDLYLAPGNDYSLDIQNTISINLQGVPANSTIERCEFWEGIYLSGIGDSNSIRNNIFKSTSGSGRMGIYLYHVDGSGGVASHTVINENNFVCDGGSLRAVRGRNIKFNYNNVEQSYGIGTSGGAVIDIDGSSGTIPWPEICGNSIILFGTTTVTSAVRINNTIGAKVDNNTILSGITITNGILTTSSCETAYLGTNEIDTDFTNAINDSGIGTSGVGKTLSLETGITNVDLGYATASCYKTNDNAVYLNGYLTTTGSITNGATITTLPSGFRPLDLQRYIAYATVSSVVSFGAVEINSSGIINYYGNNATNLSLNGISFTTQSYVSGAL